MYKVSVWFALQVNCISRFFQHASPCNVSRNVATLAAQIVRTFSAWMAHDVVIKTQFLSEKVKRSKVTQLRNISKLTTAKPSLLYTLVWQNIHLLIIGRHNLLPAPCGKSVSRRHIKEERPSCVVDEFHYRCLVFQSAFYCPRSDLSCRTLSMRPCYSLNHQRNMVHHLCVCACV